MRIRQNPRDLFGIVAGDFSAALALAFLTIAAGSAFGLLTGLGAQAGILSMVVVTLVGWVFGGAPVKVTGPTAPTAAAMLAALATLDAYGGGVETALLATILAGGFVMLMGLAPVARLGAAIPNATTSIFVNGIALIIVAKQLKIIAAYWQSPVALAEIGIVIATFAILSLWRLVAARLAHAPWSRLVSGSLIAMVIASLTAQVFGWPVAKLEMVALDPSAIFNHALGQAVSVPLCLLVFVAMKLALIIAFVTLVTVRALGAKSGYAAELRNVGLGNIAVGAIGGVASTIGFTRSKILVRAGGRTPLAGIFTALIVLAIVLLAPALLETIPRAVFVGILLRAAWVSFDWQFLTALRTPNRANIALGALVIAGSVAMIFADVVLVVGISILAWWVINQWQAPKVGQMDFTICPIANLEKQME